MRLTDISHHRPHGQAGERVFTLTYEWDDEQFDVRVSLNPPDVDEGIVVDGTDIPCTAPGDVEPHARRTVIQIEDRFE